MAALAIVVVVGVVFRKSGASLIWYDEIASILLAWLTYYGAALAALNRAHIGMPTLVDRMKGVQRTAIVLFGEVCTLAFFGVLTWAGIRVLTVTRWNDARVAPVRPDVAGSVGHSDRVGALHCCPAAVASGCARGSIRRRRAAFGTRGRIRRREGRRLSLLAIALLLLVLVVLGIPIAIALGLVAVIAMITRSGRRRRATERGPGHVRRCDPRFR